MFVMKLVGWRRHAPLPLRIALSRKTRELLYQAGYVLIVGTAMIGWLSLLGWCLIEVL
jgi:hypothetical protein